MSRIKESIDVNVPIDIAYNQWTQFEQFPRFMDGVETVQQLTDRTMTWTASMAGQKRDFDVEITEQRPDDRIAWSTTSGLMHTGVATFEPIGDDRARVAVQIDFEPEGMSEKLADRTGFVENRVRNDLENFKEFIEDRGRETGAYRETIS
ncbi:MAG: SRPBCC family protein [Thermoleophilia bacterium]